MLKKKNSQTHKRAAHTNKKQLRRYETECEILKCAILTFSHINRHDWNEPFIGKQNKGIVFFYLFMFFYTRIN